MPKIAALILLLVLLAGPLRPASEDLKPESDRLRKVLEKSLLFPGLGQLSEKQYVKAAVFASLEVFCLAKVAIHIGKGNEAYRNYRDAKDADAATAWRLQTATYDRQRNTAILAAAGVWVLNMVDIFVFAKKKYGRNAAVAFYPYYNHENQAFGAGCSYRF